MDIYKLGAVTWWESQCYYHALAVLGREGLIICYPTSPYVCLGMHDDLEQEIDQDYCKEQGLPLLRRETGGGVVYLDKQQLFYQMVLRKDNPLLPRCRDRFYTKFLKPAISVCRQMGMPAELKPLADIAAAGCKCSGNAAGDLAKGVAYIGNILIDFDFATMSRVLKVPTEDFHSHLLKYMRANMTSLSDWVADTPEPYELIPLLIAGFCEIFGTFTPQLPDEELMKMAAKMRQKLTSREFLTLPGRRYLKRRVKIAEDIYLLEDKLKTGESTTVLIRNGQVENIYLPGQSDDDEDLPGIYRGQKWEDALLEKCL